MLHIVVEDLLNDIARELDRELFGEEGGPGRAGHIGVFERAHGGTLYIDDVADMPRESQSRILPRIVSTYSCGRITRAMVFTKSFHFVSSRASCFLPFLVRR